MAKLRINIIEDRRGIPVVLPANQRAIDELRAILRIVEGKVYGIVVQYTEHDWLRERYFGVLDECADALDIQRSELHIRLKYAAGLHKGWIAGEHGPIVVLKSIANKTNGGDLTPSERAQYFDRAYEILFERFVDAHERPELFARVEARIGPRPPR